MVVLNFFDSSIDSDIYLDNAINAASNKKQYDYNRNTALSKGFKNEFHNSLCFILLPIPYVKMEHNPLNMYDYCNEEDKKPYDRAFIFEDGTRIKVEDKFRSNGVKVCHKFIEEEFASKDCKIILIENKDSVSKEDKWYLQSIGKIMMNLEELYSFIYLKAIKIHNQIILSKQSTTYRIDNISFNLSYIITHSFQVLTRKISEFYYKNRLKRNFSKLKSHFRAKLSKSHFRSISNHNGE